MESAFRSFLTCLLLPSLYSPLALELSRRFPRARYRELWLIHSAIVPGAGVKATNAERTGHHHD